MTLESALELYWSFYGELSLLEQVSPDTMSKAAPKGGRPRSLDLGDLVLGGE